MELEIQVITPTEEQKRASEGVLEDLDKKIPTALMGRAGVGKTTTVRHIRNFLDMDSIVCAAPTHQACHILREVIQHPVCTVASLLSKRREVDYVTGEVLFEPEDFVNHSDSTIIIDEASMIGGTDKNALFRNFPKASFLFVGDPGQLPPIKEESFSIFNHVNKHELLTNMRCGKGNVLFDNIERIYNSSEISLKDIVIGGNTYEMKVEDLTLDDVVVTYYNKRKDYYNNLILKEHFGGEITTEVKMIANANLRYSKDGQYVLTNGERFFPTQVIPTVFKLDRIRAIPKLEIAGYYLKYGRTTLNYIPNRDLLSPYLEYYKSHKSWRDFYNLQSEFDDISLAYAITSHKVQGSTYEHVTVDVGDIMSSPIGVRKASLYVAMSRAKEKVNLLNL